METYIINEINGMRKPIIERYLKLQKTLDNLFDNCDAVINFEQDYEDVAYDFDYMITLKNNDDAKQNIFKLRDWINKHTVLYAKILEDQLEDALLDKDEEYIVIDLYCFIICRK